MWLVIFSPTVMALDLVLLALVWWMWGCLHLWLLAQVLVHRGPEPRRVAVVLWLVVALGVV